MNYIRLELLSATFQLSSWRWEETGVFGETTRICFFVEYYIIVDKSS